MADLELSSPAFTQGSRIPDRFAKESQNLSPPLVWSGLPAETVELAVSCEDPDAPSGTWIHWLVAGLDPTLPGLEEGQLPERAVCGRTSYGEVSYGGPRPPVGDKPHRYFFTLYACGSPLGLEQGFDVDAFRTAIAQNEIARATILGTYSREG